MAESDQEDEYAVQEDVFTGSYTSVQRTGKEYDKRHSNAVCKLAGKGAGNVSAPHGVCLHEEKKQGKDCADDRDWKPLIHESERRITAQRKDKDSKNGNEFKGNLKRNEI